MGIGAFLLFMPFSFRLSFPLLNSTGEEEEGVGNTCEPKGLKQPVIRLNEISMTMIKLLKVVFRTTDFKDLQLLHSRRLQMLHGTIIHPLI